MQEGFCDIERYCKYMTNQKLLYKGNTCILQLISQQQAIITIVDDKHFISDAYSSNGTYLNKNPLTPLKLYELTDDCSIDFAGINARYKKVMMKLTLIKNNKFLGYR